VACVGPVWDTDWITGRVVRPPADPVGLTSQHENTVGRSRTALDSTKNRDGGVAVAVAAGIRHVTVSPLIDTPGEAVALRAPHETTVPSAP